MNSTNETIKTVVGMVKSQDAAAKVASLIAGEMDEGCRVETLNTGSKWAIVIESDYELETETEAEYRGLVRGIILALGL